MFHTYLSHFYRYTFSACFMTGCLVLNTLLLSSTHLDVLFMVTSARLPVVLPVRCSSQLFEVI